MASSIPLQIAETIQTASINRAPSPTHDINPSTAASFKEPVTVSNPNAYPDEEIDGLDDDEEASDLADDDDDIPYGVIEAKPRKSTMPPLPDLRFEQSYLASIKDVDSPWKVAFITVRDQVRARPRTFCHGGNGGRG